MRPTSIIVLAAGLGLLSCKGSGADEPGADEYFYDCEGSPPASLKVFATDEGFVEFINKATANAYMMSETQAPVLTAPAAGGGLSASAPPQVVFRSAAMTFDRSGNGRPPASRPRSLWSRARSWLSFEGTAWAHCPAVTGETFLFQLTADGAKDPAYTAFLSVTSFTPGAAKWKAALGPLAGKTVNLRLARAVFSQGSITLGPFVSPTPVTFNVTQ